MMIVQVTIRGDAGTLRQAADLLAKRVVGRGARAFAIPADNEQYSAAIDNGAIKTLVQAGFTICAPGTPDPAAANGEKDVRHPGIALPEVIDGCCNAGDRQ
jgi:homoaconitase/3-isopropylmalate dehydratase large subunit